VINAHLLIEEACREDASDWRKLNTKNGSNHPAKFLLPERKDTY
jgi:hypothetical protein